MEDLVSFTASGVIAGGAAATLTFEPKLGEEVELKVLSMQDSTSQSDHQMRIFAKNALVDTSGEQPRWSASSGDTVTPDAVAAHVKEVKTVAANTRTTWEPAREVILRPGDKVEFVFTNGVNADVLKASILGHRRPWSG